MVTPSREIGFTTQRNQSLQTKAAMSLRGFHIVFVIVTTLLSLFLTGWALFLAPVTVGVIRPILMVAGIAGTIGFPVYGVYFYRKARKLIL